jgi:hypothetical protein
MTEGFPFFDGSPGDDGVLAAWQPGPGHQPTPSPFTDPRFLADPAADSAEEGQESDARRAWLEAADVRHEDYARVAAALPDRETRRRVARAWHHAVDGHYWEAEQELRLAAQESGDGSAQQLMDLRRRLTEGTAADWTGRQLRRFDRVTVTHGPSPGHPGTWDETGVVESVFTPGRVREALVYPEGQHLWPGHGETFRYNQLTITGRGQDPVTLADARQYARLLTPAIRLSEYERAAVALAARLGQAADHGPLPDDQREALATVTRLGQAADGTAIRRAIRHHRARHSRSGGGDTIQYCPSERCVVARGDWQKLAWQFPPPAGTTQARRSSRRPAGRAGAAPVIPATRRTR